MNIKITSTISITEILPTDRPSYIKHLNATNVGKWMGSMPYPYLESDCDFWFEQLEKQKEKYGYAINFAIRKDDELIGGIGLYDYNPKFLEGGNQNSLGKNNNTNHHWASLGYWLANEFSGNGIMSEVVAKFVPHIVKEFNLIRLEAAVWHPNTASRKVLEKNGFVLEGVCKKFYLQNDEYFDRLIFAKVL